MLALPHAAWAQEAAAAAETGADWTSILPPVVAIVVALIARRVIPALFLGIWLGAWLATGDLLVGWWTGLLDTVDTYVVDALADEGHVAIIVFSLMIGGMVGIIQKNGGTRGIVRRITGWASTPRTGQLTTGFLGVAIFFDDYANTLVVGNTMRPVTDRLRISREKLAYLVDSTAAPIAALAFVTTWIGYEVGLIGTATDQLPGLNLSGYAVFLRSIPYSFYPLLALFFVFAIANSRRDFGPMYEAEVRARTTGQVVRPGAKVDEAAVEGQELLPKEGKPVRAFNAIAPVLVLVVGVLVGLYVTGSAAIEEARAAGEEVRSGLGGIIGAADSYSALMWASLVSVLVAVGLSVGQRILTLEEAVEAWYAGLRAMLFAMIVLILAWSLGAVTEALGTGDFLAQTLGSALPPGLVPAVIFVLAAFTAFATGTSWGTMGILIPLVVPFTWEVLQQAGRPEDLYLLYSAVACVLAGAVWGDHCSPISDTTVLSSMASGCDHIDHVRTQLPYALWVGFVALFVCTIPTGFGAPWWIMLPLSAAILSVAIRVLGKRADDAVVEGEPVAA